VLESWQLSQISLRYNPKQKERKINGNEKPLSTVCPVYYSPTRLSGWVLADYGGKY